MGIKRAVNKVRRSPGSIGDRRPVPQGEYLPLIGDYLKEKYPTLANTKLLKRDVPNILNNSYLSEAEKNHAILMKAGKAIYDLPKEQQAEVLKLMKEHLGEVTRFHAGTGVYSHLRRRPGFF